MNLPGTYEIHRQNLTVESKSDIKVPPLFQGLIQPSVDLTALRTASDRLLVQLEVPNRALRCFETQGIKTVRELVQMTPEELLSIRSFGERSLRQVRMALVNYFNVKHRESTKNRWAYLSDLYATHHSYEAVGRQLGIKRQRVQQIVSFGKRIGALPKDLVEHTEKLREKQRVINIAQKNTTQDADAGLYFLW